MIYNFNGKKINIPTNEIEKLQKTLELSEQEAIELWLCDNGYDEDEEQEELDEKASKVKILKDIDKKSSKKERKPVVRKISDEKKALFNEILSNLQDIYKENVEILTENKLIEVKINNSTFKIDVIQCRDKKKS